MVEALPILGEPATSIEPGYRALDDPALWQHQELVQLGPPNDLDVDVMENLPYSGLKLGALVTAVGIWFQQEGIQSEQRAHQQHTAIAVLDVGGVDHRLHQQALGIDQDMALLSLDLLARIVPRRIDADPPFSALLTL